MDIECVICGKKTSRKAMSQKYCPTCSKLVRKEKLRKYQEKYYAGETYKKWKESKKGKCISCGKQTKGCSDYCTSCHQKEERNHQWKGDDVGQPGGNKRARQKKTKNNL